MTSKEHKKHSDIARPSFGNFGRNEFAIVGTNCSNIKSLADAVIKALSPKYKCAYVDADHHDADNEILPEQLRAGAFAQYTDKINYHEIKLVDHLNPVKFRQLLNEADIVLVNGNHHEAKKQIIVIDKIKESSLKKRLTQLSNVELILLSDEVDDIFDFVKEALPNWQQLPKLGLDETDKIIAFIENEMATVCPVMNGLVLAGGKSVRMGYDKSSIEWHGKEQRYYMADLLKDLCKDVFISCRAEQQKEIDGNYKTLPDTFTGLGPYGAILSAFRERPDAAWLVIASDLPLLDVHTLQYLIEHRNISSIATTFESPHDGLPEPLITIWEPKSYAILLSFLSQGYSCPRKALINNDTSIIKASYPEKLVNVNTEEELIKAKKILFDKISTA